MTSWLWGLPRKQVAPKGVGFDASILRSENIRIKTTEMLPLKREAALKAVGRDERLVGLNPTVSSMYKEKYVLHW